MRPASRLTCVYTQPQSLDVFMAGDDVESKKPDPMIYRIAAERLNVDPQQCLVVEDSTIGLQVTCHAALKCITQSVPAHAALTRSTIAGGKGSRPP